MSFTVPTSPRRGPSKYSRLRIPAYALPLCSTECGEDEMPRTAPTEAAEVVVDRLPRRKVVREVAPRASRPEQVEDRVEDGAQRVAARLSAGSVRRQMTL